MQMSIAKEALGLNKGEFTKKLSNVVNAHRANSKIIGKPRDFLLTACRLTDRFSKVANEPDVEVRLKNMKVGPRSVKVIISFVRLISSSNQYLVGSSLTSYIRQELRFAKRHLKRNMRLL